MLWVLLVLPLALANPFAWDDNCGRSPYGDAGIPQRLAEKYIVGGWPAREHEFPWQVSLRYTGGNHWCGGFLVTPGHVITASHCVDGDTAGDLEVVAGEHLRDTENDDKQLLGVANITMHPNYGPALLVNDAAVLVLSENVTINENVGTICAPTAGHNHTGIDAVVSGWGEDHVPPPGSTNELRYYVGPIISNEACQECLNGITDDMVCQGACGNNPGDSCQGDSGGPLGYKDADGLWTIIGIVSWGFGCADETPGVYSRVEDNLDWFTEVIDNSTRTG